MNLKEAWIGLCVWWARSWRPEWPSVLWPSLLSEAHPQNRGTRSHQSLRNWTLHIRSLPFSLLQHKCWAFGRDWEARLNELITAFLVLVILLSVSRVICRLNTIWIQLLMSELMMISDSYLQVLTMCWALWRPFEHFTSCNPYNNQKE